LDISPTITNNSNLQRIINEKYKFDWSIGRMKLQEFTSGFRLSELTPPMPGAAAPGAKPSPLGTFAAGAAGSKPPAAGQPPAPAMDPQAMAKQQAAQIKQMADRKKAIQEQIKEMQKQIQELQKELGTLK
jgi:hypothetical protein